jgi:hypothetical protein
LKNSNFEFQSLKKKIGAADVSPATTQWRVFRTRVTFIICDSCYREVSRICFPIGDASSENASRTLSVTCFVNQRHQYYNLSVTRLDNTWHIFYPWRVLLTCVTNTSLLVTRLAPGAWATTNRWRVSWTRVTDRLLVTRFVFVSRIPVSLITFSGIVSQPEPAAGTSNRTHGKSKIDRLTTLESVEIIDGLDGVCTEWNW